MYIVQNLFHRGKHHKAISLIFIGNVMCKDYWFSKYNRVLLHYSVSISAAVAFITLSAAAAYIHLSAEAAASGGVYSSGSGGGGGGFPSVGGGGGGYSPVCGSKFYVLQTKIILS
jgi:uncharacterized membrane protein YgcG